MGQGYAAQLGIANPSFVGFAHESQRSGIAIPGCRPHRRAATRQTTAGDKMQMSNLTSAPSHDATSPANEDAFWWQGGLYRIKARATDTGGALGLVEASLYQGFGPPLHVHRREDEA